MVPEGFAVLSVGTIFVDSEDIIFEIGGKSDDPTDASYSDFSRLVFKKDYQRKGSLSSIHERISA